MSNEELISLLQQCTDPREVLCLIEPETLGHRREIYFNSIAAAFQALGRIIRSNPRFGAKYAQKDSAGLLTIREGYKRLFARLGEIRDFDMDPQGAATILFSMALLWLHVPNRKVIGRFWPKYWTLAKVVLRNPNLVEPNSIGGVMWSMEKINYQGNSNFAKLLKHAMKIDLDKWSTDSICGILYAMASARLKFRFLIGVRVERIYEFVNQLLTTVTPRIPEIKALNFGKVMWAVRRLRFYHDDFMRGVELYLIQNTSRANFRNSQVCSILLAFADLGIAREHRNMVVKRLVEQYRRRYDGESQHIATMLYALTMIGVKVKYCHIVMNCLLQAKKGEIPDDFFKTKELAMIRRAQLHVRGVQKVKELQIPRRLENLSIAAAQTEAKRLARLSFEATDQVFEEIKKLFPTAQKRITFINNEFSAQVRYFDGDRFVVVDVLTFGNYVYNKPGIILNSLVQKQLLLESVGYRVLMVDNTEWKINQEYRNFIISLFPCQKSQNQSPIQWEVKGTSREQSSSDSNRSQSQELNQTSYQHPSTYNQSQQAVSNAQNDDYNYQYSNDPNIVLENQYLVDKQIQTQSEFPQYDEEYTDMSIQMQRERGNDSGNQKEIFVTPQFQQNSLGTESQQFITNKSDLDKSNIGQENEQFFIDQFRFVHNYLELQKQQFDVDQYDYQDKGYQQGQLVKYEQRDLGQQQGQSVEKGKTLWFDEKQQGQFKQGQNKRQKKWWKKKKAKKMQDQNGLIK